MFIEQLTDEQKNKILDIFKDFSKNNQIKNVKFVQAEDSIRIKVELLFRSGNFTVVLRDFSSKVIIPTIWCGRYQTSTKYNTEYIKFMEETFREQDYKKEFVKYHTERIQQRADKDISLLEKIFE